MHVFLDGGLGQTQPDSDLLVGQKGGQPQTLFLAGAQALRHSTLRYRPNSYGARTPSSSVGS